MIFTTERVKDLNKVRLSSNYLRKALVQKVYQLIELAAQDGHLLLVTQGYRSSEEQNKLYAQGRTTKGKIVTNAKGGQSKHNTGQAVDLAFIVNGEVVWTESLYKKIGVWAKIVGLKWGGDWKTFKDKPHVEI